MKARKTRFCEVIGSMNDLNDMNGSRITQWMYRQTMVWKVRVLPLEETIELLPQHLDRLRDQPNLA
jgi:hypothetical protein